MFINMIFLFGINLLMAKDSKNFHKNDHVEEDSAKLFEQFRINFNKSYADKGDYNARMKIFMENLQSISRHNSNSNNTFNVSINQFTDMTFAELYALNDPNDDAFGYKLNTSSFKSPPIKLKSFRKEKTVPDEFDWRQHGLASRVKDQGLCGSCYAFAFLEEIESKLKLHQNKSFEFSRQEIVDCSGKHGTLGCSGGLLSSVYSYINEGGGLVEEKDYRYEAKHAECRRDFYPKINLTIKTVFEVVPHYDEEALKYALYENGPVVAFIDNLHESFFRYSSGVYYEQECNYSGSSSHVVLVVGYGSTKKGDDFWIIKNSYGESWGEDGYMRIARNRDSHCEIASFTMMSAL